MSTDDEPTDGVLANEFTGIVYSRGPSPIPALSVAECRRQVAAATWRGGWCLTELTPITHVDGCECEAADGFVLEEIDERCAEGTPYTAVMLDDGQYHEAAINLDAYAALVHDAMYEDGLVPPIVVEPDGTPRLVGSDITVEAVAAARQQAFTEAIAIVTDCPHWQRTSLCSDMLDAIVAALMEASKP